MAGVSERQQEIVWLPVTLDSKMIWLWQVPWYRWHGYATVPAWILPVRFYAALNEMQPHECIGEGYPPTYRRLPP